MFNKTCARILTKPTSTITLFPISNIHTFSLLSFRDRTKRDREKGKRDGGKKRGSRAAGGTSWMRQGHHVANSGVLARLQRSGGSSKVNKIAGELRNEKLATFKRQEEMINTAQVSENHILDSKRERER